MNSFQDLSLNDIYSFFLEFLKLPQPVIDLQYSFAKKNNKMINQKEFIEKKTRIERASEILKTEYFGIDDVIDQILDAISSWYFFHELQEKPLVINLWGLTGTGKTSLIKRLFALLKLEKGSFIYDIRSDSRENSIYSILETVNAHYQNLPFALLIDEFQHAKTINEKGEEHVRPGRVDLWELLDSGELNMNLNFHVLNNIYSLIIDLRLKIALGLKGENGLVTYDPADISERKSSRRGNRLRAKEAMVYDSYYDVITCLDPGRFPDESSVQNQLMKLNEKETLTLLNEVYEEGKKPKTINAKKSLIFIAGNLDEAYRMSGEVEQEVDADDLYEQSRKITLSDIKLALQTRFRNEQIARLGNIHIIYPSLNRKAYEQILKLELDKVSDLLHSQAGVKLEFENTLLDKIYEEGVSPAQGTRPVFSTIHLWVRGQLGKMLVPIIEKRLKPDCIILDYSNKAVHLKYQKSGITIHQDTYEPYSFNDKVRENKEPGLRYIVAIHEAGHIIASIKLLNHIPKNATSLSVSSTREGFVSIQRPKSYYEKDINNWLATLIAGGVAEKQVFGTQHVPFGTGEDHRMATNFILNLLKSGAIGETPGVYYEGALFGENNLKDDQNRLSKIAEEWLRKAQLLSKETLLRFEKPLIYLAEMLLEKNYLNKDDLTEFARVHLNHHVEGLEVASFYEESFKQKLASVKVTDPFLNKTSS